MTTEQLHNFLAVKVMGWRKVEPLCHGAHPHYADSNDSRLIVRDWTPTVSLRDAMMILDRCLDLQPTLCISKFMAGKRVVYLVGSQKAPTFAKAICKFAYDRFQPDRPFIPIMSKHLFTPNTFDGLCAKCDGRWDDKRHGAVRAAPIRTKFL